MARDSDKKKPDSVVRTPVATPVERRVLALLLVAGAALRLWFWLSVRDSHLATIPYLAAHDYDQWARALVAGDWGRGQPYWMGPLYPHLLALVYTVFGAGNTAPLLLQLGLSLLNILLVWRLARRWTGPGTSLLAAALYAGYGPPVFYAGLRLMVTVVTTLTLLIAQQATRAVDEPGPPSWRRWLGLGMLVGLAATARGNLLMFLPAFTLLLPWRTAAARRPALLAGAALWLGAGLAILPVTVRNVVVGGDLVLLTSNAGVNLLIGQQSQYGGIFGPLSRKPQFEFDPTGETLLEAEGGAELRPSEVSRQLAGRALARMAEDPADMAAHYARKAYRLASAYELPQIHDWNYWQPRLPALMAYPVTALLLLALGLPGVAALRGAARRVWLAMLGGWFLGLLPFFPTARYRLPMMPLLAVSAAACLAALVRARRRGDRRRMLMMGGAAVLLAVALWPGWTALDRTAVDWHGHLGRASRAADAGDRAAMIAACAEADALRPGSAETAYRQGGFHEKMGDLDGALTAYAEARRRLPGDRFVLYRHARTLAALGRHHEALAGYAAATAADSTWSFPWHGRSLSLRDLGRMEEAEDAMRRAVTLEPGRARYRSNLASLLAETGRLAEARDILRELTADFPGYVPGWFNLALTEARLGDHATARRAVDRAAALPGLTPTQRRQVEDLARRLSGDDGDGSGR
jgi:4-amino-4-deoxy-L-arabinose transferase-like glycosyltransferase